MLSILRLIRFPNLLMLLLTVFIYGNRILYPTIGAHGIAPVFVFKDFLSLLFIFICVAAAGYIHNDITDTKTDLSNNKRQIIGQTITRWLAWMLLFFFILSPLPLLYYLCSEIDNFNYVLYYFVVIGLLLCYNKWLQRLPLIGNIVVAGLCGLVVILPAWAEIDAVNKIASINKEAYNQIWIITIGYAAFAFFSNLIRELIKDIEDIEGDKTDNYNTLPIAIGINRAKLIITIIQTLLVALLIAWIHYIQTTITTSITLSILLIAPMLFLIWKVSQAKRTEDYTQLSEWLKFYFSTGVIALFFI